VACVVRVRACVCSEQRPGQADEPCGRADDARGDQQARGGRSIGRAPSGGRAGGCCSRARSGGRGDGGRGHRRTPELCEASGVQCGLVPVELSGSQRAQIQRNRLVAMDRARARLAAHEPASPAPRRTRLNRERETVFDDDSQGESDSTNEENWWEPNRPSGGWWGGRGSVTGRDVARSYRRRDAWEGESEYRDGVLGPATLPPSATKSSAALGATPPPAPGEERVATSHSRGRVRSLADGGPPAARRARRPAILRLFRLSHLRHSEATGSRDSLDLLNEDEPLPTHPNAHRWVATRPLTSLATCESICRGLGLFPPDMRR
jgi:hypothetical protein